MGNIASYSLTVSNLGPDVPNAPITVTNVLPVGLNFVSVSDPAWACSGSGQVVSCTANIPVAVGATARVTLSVSIGAEAYPTVTNVAGLLYAGDGNAANNTARLPTTVRR